MTDLRVSAAMTGRAALGVDTLLVTSNSRPVTTRHRDRRMPRGAHRCLSSFGRSATCSIARKGKSVGGPAQPWRCTREVGRPTNYWPSDSRRSANHDEISVRERQKPELPPRRKPDVFRIHHFIANRPSSTPRGRSTRRSRVPLRRRRRDPSDYARNTRRRRQTPTPK